MFHRHIESEKSIWVDASFIINTNLDDWWEQHFKEPITVIRHPVRHCIYTEAGACIKRHKDAPQLIRRQISDYRKIGVPIKNGLIASGVIMRKMSQPVIDLCELWYDQVKKYSSRDQIAFGFAGWKNPVHHTIEWDYRNATEFLHVPHLHKRIIL